MAEIVHSNVHHRNGQCNKNLGSNFLLIWRIGEEKELMQNNDISKFSKFGNKVKNHFVTDGRKQYSGVYNTTDNTIDNTTDNTMNNTVNNVNKNVNDILFEILL